MYSIYYSTTRSPGIAVETKPRAGSWIHLVDPTPDELAYLEQTFSLDPDLLADALDVYESPRVEQEGENVYIFTRYCFPQGVAIATEPLLIVHTPEHVITVMRSASSMFDRFILGAARVVTTQKTKLVLEFLEEINQSYRQHIHRVNRQILGFRTQMKRDNLGNRELIQFIDLEDDLNECLTALQPYGVLLRTLLTGRYFRLYEDDKDLIEDLLLGATELIDLTNSRLVTISNIREAYATIAANNLNSVFKRLTSIGIFLAIPTVVSSLYGMNVDLPLADNPAAFWILVGVIVASTASVMVFFFRKRWL